MEINNYFRKTQINEQMKTTKMNLKATKMTKNNRQNLGQKC